MNTKWFLRNIVLNLVLLLVMIGGAAVHFGFIDMLTPTQVNQKGQETLTLLYKQGCVPDRQLREELDLNYIQYTRLRTILQKKRLMLHYECGFKNTYRGKIHVELKDPPRIQEYQEVKPGEAKPGEFSQKALTPKPLED